MAAVSQQQQSNNQAGKKTNLPAGHSATKEGKEKRKGKIKAKNSEAAVMPTTKVK